MNQLKYKTHLILHSKYKFLINILLYIIILIFYNTYINNLNIIDCMVSDIPEEKLEYIYYLENEIHNLRSQINDLETSHIREEEVLKTLEDNQGYLIDKVRSLEEQLSEANQTIGEMAGDNIDLRTKAYEKHQAYVDRIRELEEEKKRCEDHLSQFKK